VIDDVVGLRKSNEILPLVAAVLLATLAQSFSARAFAYILERAALRVTTDLRKRVYEHILRLPVQFFETQPVGSLISRIMNDVEGVRGLVSAGLFGFFSSVLTGILALALLLRTSRLLSLISVVILAASMVLLRGRVSAMRDAFHKRAAITGEIQGRLTESLFGIRVVKAYHAQVQEEATFSGGLARLNRSLLVTMDIGAWMNYWMTVVPSIGLIVVMYVGAREILVGSLTVGQFVTFNALLLLLQSPATQLATIGTQITEAVAGIERTRDVLNQPIEEDDPRRTISLGTIRGEVIFNDVSFSYQGNRSALRNISFRAPSGSLTALVGPSGGGKSTVISLIAGFYQPCSGKILVDDIDITTVRLDSYRPQIAMVLQDTFLFDGTIEENVRFSRPDASEVEVLEACRMAHVDEFAVRFASGYKTIVGERGAKLSGGQAQRVAIARAILADARILILDEATSNLDYESERYIHEALTRLTIGKTTFAISHRLETARRADKVLFFEEGRLIETGTHEELYSDDSRYRRLSDLTNRVICA
jgi:subfamily B ATP-binding cassette protein MsbA